MKKKLFALLTALCLLFCLIPAASAATTASGTCGDNLTWVLDKNGTLTISGSGPMPDFDFPINDSDDNPWSPYASEITAVVVKEGVTTIGDYAFYQYKNLVSLTLPEGLTSIGRSAFHYCSITELDLPDGLLTLDGFNGNPITELVIPDSVTTIGDYAFIECTELTSVTLPTGLENLGSCAFDCCYQLSNVVMPEMPNFQSLGIFGRIFCACDFTDLSWYTLSEIGYQMFNSNHFVELVIPDGVTVVNDFAFAGCDSMTKVTIPAGVTYVGSAAFGDCDALEEVHFLGDPPELGYELFQNLTDVTCYYPADNENWTADDLNTYGGIVTWVPHTSLSITTQPKNAYAQSGATVKTTVKAAGDGLTYQWYIKNAGGSKFSKSSVTGATYSCRMSDASDGRQAYCVITDQYGCSVTTNTVTLKMATPLEIVTQPKTGYAKSGATVKTTVKAAGDGLTYQWYVKNAGATKYIKSSITSATYSCTMSDAVKGRRVYCVITDQYGNSVQTKTVLLRMSATITTQPKSVTVAEGATAKVTVKATGDGLTYKWYYKNAGASKFSLTTSFTGNTYSVSMTDARDGRQVYCVITDQYGKSVTSNTVTLRMEHYATITTQPKSVTVAEGKTAKVTVKATGDGLTYKWYYKNAGASKFSLTTSFTGNTYSVSMTDARDGRQVYCVVTDKYGNSVKSGIVTLSMK